MDNVVIKMIKNGENTIKTVKKEVADYLVGKGDAEYSDGSKKDLKGMICK